MEINTELVGRVLDRIIARPREWCQTSFCGTRCCFAGHTLLEAGYHVGACGYFINENGGEVLASFQAAQLLGFDSDQVEEIFYYFPEDELADSGTEWSERAALTAMINRVAEVTGIDPAPYLAKVADLP